MTVILGADEETACRDTAYYYERYEEALVEGISKDILKEMCVTAEQETELSFHIMPGERAKALRVLAVGKSTHASTPWEGVRAVTELLRLLVKLPMADSRGFTALCTS